MSLDCLDGFDEIHMDELDRLNHLAFTLIKSHNVLPLIRHLRDSFWGGVFLILSAFCMLHLQLVWPIE